MLDETKGNVACNVGPHKMSLSQSDNLVKFDTRTKKFIPCEKYRDAIQLFVTAPEGWYIALKNPAPANKYMMLIVLMQQKKIELLIARNLTLLMVRL